MFPIAQKQFASMAAMRAVQPKMKALQEKFKDDKPRLQQEMMELYRKEKVNPLAGCLPMFLQIPIFFALYKVLIDRTEHTSELQSLMRISYAVFCLKKQKTTQLVITIKIHTQ